MSTNKPLIKTIDLIKYFNTPNGLLHAVDGINLSIEKGETLGIVGESGCGKSTLGRTILRLIEPTSGQILYDGEDICRLNDRQMKEMRKKMQIIFQDPYASLNPRLSVGELIAEPMKVTKMFDSRKQLDERIFQLMEIVGIDDRFVNSYPHELDGGKTSAYRDCESFIFES